MEIDNRWMADYDKAVAIIKSEVNKKISKFELTEENLKRKTSYYYLIYNYKNISLEIGGERGAIDFLLKIDDEAIDLYEEDEKFDELKTASENNFIIFIRLLKEYLEKNKLI
jgi:hypothetical protein